MKVVAIIPARYASTRLPGKPLKEIAGQPMIQHVYERTNQANHLDQVIVATDDQRIYNQVADFGGQVRMTSSEHQTGTDRLAEVAQDLEAEIIVNVQGDEPLIRPEMIDQAVQPLVADKTLQMSTLKQLITDQAELKNPNLVKVVTDKNDFALYFSRAPIPYPGQEVKVDYYKHIGLYVYRRNFLLDYANLEPTPLEQQESLEQLRALENGYQIKVVETEHKLVGVDTPQDLEQVRELLEE
ncbi:3-deoxy-manno-octulosonate cytidylyltransferase [Halanaerobaculum tunisiense]